MKWIKCSERLPSSRDRVLAYGCAACGTCSPTIKVQFCMWDPEDGFEFGEYDCPFDATHWMPLPNPPEEG